MPTAAATGMNSVATSVLQNAICEFGPVARIVRISFGRSDRYPA